MIMSRFLIVCFSFSFALLNASNSTPIPVKKELITKKTKSGPSTAHKVFGFLKNLSNTYMLVGLAVTLFCGYLWLVKEVNSPVRIAAMSKKQEEIILALGQLQTPRDQLRTLPQVIKVDWLELLKNIDLATAISASVVVGAAGASVIFAGFEALT